MQILRVNQQGPVLGLEATDEALLLRIVSRSIEGAGNPHAVFCEQLAGPLIAGEGRILIMMHDERLQVHLFLT